MLTFNKSASKKWHNQRYLAAIARDGFRGLITGNHAAVKESKVEKKANSSGVVAAKVSK